MWARVSRAWSEMSQSRCGQTTLGLKRPVTEFGVCLVNNARPLERVLHEEMGDSVLI